MKRWSASSWLDHLAARPALFSLLLLVIALAARALALGRYVTPDEPIWVYRSILFREALLAQRWADTLVAGHPGVVTTWLGSMAISLQLFLRTGDRVVYDWITHLAYLTPDNMDAYRQLYHFLDSGRLAIALANSLGLVALFWLVRALFSSRTAVIAALILALEPFFSGLSGLFHVDGLLATWSILAILALALGLGYGHADLSPRHRFLLLLMSGAAAALAVLSKSPALLLFPVAGIAFLSLFWRDALGSLWRRALFIAGRGGAWLASFLVTMVALFPALWSAPLRVLSLTSSNAERHADEALRPTFFWGDVAFDHGFAFYPVVLIWRLSPLIIGGLILLLALVLRRRKLDRSARFSMLLLALWAFMFLVGVSLAAKKFDRYIVPLVPALAILAAVALANRSAWQSRLVRGLGALLIAAQLFMLLTAVPTMLAAYNPLAGGAFTARSVLPLGWGEAISASGRWLASQPAAASQSAVSGIAPSLAPFFPGETLFLETAGWDSAERIIVTANGQQVNPDELAAMQSNYELLHIIRYALIPQAWIFANPQPQRTEITVTDLAEPAVFGEQMNLLQQGLTADDQTVLYTARWRKQAAAPLLTVKLQLIDSAGNVWQDLETDLLNEVYFYPQHWQDTETPQVTYRLNRVPAMPPGTYQVRLSLYDQRTGGLLPLTAPPGSAGVEFNGGTIDLDFAEEDRDPRRLLDSSFDDAVWLDGDLRLLGVVDQAPRGLAGSTLPIDLLWQADNALPAGLQLAVTLGGAEPFLASPGSQDSAMWPVGRAVRYKTGLPLPADLDPGVYPLTIRIVDAQGLLLPGEPLHIGDVQIDAIDRLFSLPQDIAVPLSISFGPGIWLKGVSPAALETAPGEPFSLSLVWQTEGETQDPVSAFVHLVDAAGTIVAQDDHWPGGLPSDIWSAGQVVIDEHQLLLPASSAPGTYHVAVGLYTASDGRRLAAVGEDGQPLPDDRFWLPLTIEVVE